MRTRSIHSEDRDDSKLTDLSYFTWKALTIVRWSLLEFLDSVFLLMSAIFSLPWKRCRDIKENNRVQQCDELWFEFTLAFFVCDFTVLPGVWRKGLWSWVMLQWWVQGRGSPTELRTGWVFQCEAPQADEPGGTPELWDSLNGPRRSNIQCHKTDKCFNHINKRGNQCPLLH